MERSLNIPYKKEYDKNGNVKNPIIGSYISEFDNRKKRREKDQKSRFYGESKNYHLTVHGRFKYKRIKQIEKDKFGNKKIIEHYN